MGLHMHTSPQTCPFPWEDLHPIKERDHWATRVRPPNGISIGSAVFEQLTRVPNAHTDTQITRRATAAAIGPIYVVRASDAA